MSIEAQAIARHRDLRAKFFPPAKPRVAFVRPELAKPPIPRPIRILSIERIPSSEPASITFDSLLKAVCHFTGLSRLQLFAQRRTAKVCHARQVLMYLAKEHTPHSLPWIGRRMEGRDHTTVLSGIRKIQRLVTADHAETVELIRAVRESVAEAQGGAG